MSKQAEAVVDSQKLLEQAFACYQGKEFAAARPLLERVTATEAGRPDAWTLLGMVCRELGDVAAARLAYGRAIQSDANYADAYTNLANLERAEGNPELALNCYLAAYKINPTVIGTNSIGCTLADLGRFAEATVWHERAIASQPDFADAHWDRALALLGAGDYTNGFAEYEWRFRREQPKPRDFAQATWDGQPLAGKTILLYGEQGYGDALQFLRFIPQVAELGGRIALEVLPPLLPLVGQLPGVTAVVAAGQALPAFDVHASIMSLPALLKISFANLPTTPYLTVGRAALDAKRTLLGAGGDLRVGLVWAGNPNVKNDRFRSPRLGVLRPLLKAPGVRFFGLQKGPGRDDLLPGDPIIDLDEQIQDFADTAALIAALDLVITSDTSVAHLAGALGVRAWIVLPLVADWRWIGGVANSYWYPTLRLFRQRQRNDWAQVVDMLGEELAQLVATKNDATGPLTAAFAAYQQGDLPRAAVFAQRSLDAEVRRPDAWTLYGMVCRKQGDERAAVGAYREALRLNPQFADARCNLGNLYKAQGHMAAAQDCYLAVLAQDTRHFAALRELSDVARCLGQAEQAVGFAERALAIQPVAPDVLNNLGAALSELNRMAEAEAALSLSIRQNPGQIESLYNLGIVLHKQGKDNPAIELFQRVIDCDGRHAKAFYNLGVVQQGLGDFPKAEASYRQAIEIDPDYFSALFNLGALYGFTGKFAEALACEERCLALNPKHLGARAEALHLSMKFCDWRHLDRDVAMIKAGILENGEVPEEMPPFVMLSLPTELDERAQLAVAKRSARSIAERITPLPAVRPHPKKRLRIGYASSDFHDHATLHLMGAIFRLHDRESFEVYGYSWGPDDGSPYRREAIGGMDSFAELKGQGAEAIARRIRADEVDILIDLKGYTRDCKSEIFAYRPAPVQAQYLGYPGSMGADFIDYVITDRIVTPPEAQVAYTEKFAYLPHSYQVNDRWQAIGEPLLSRADCALPAEGMVFTCFCTHYKIDPLVFDTWMKILKRVPGSVLWLCSGAPAAETNLRREAELRGVAGGRLIFGKVLPKAAHLSRLRHADLFLDTYWYNGHTTASDALWAGVPVLTLPGHRFASRVGASLVSAAGMPELIAEDFRQYEELAVEIGLSPQRCAELRGKLADLRMTCPLFDTPLFVQDLESLYHRIWEESCQETEQGRGQ